jgi:RimJ/RimL family protein N-acetyltransferase
MLRFPDRLQTPRLLLRCLDGEDAPAVKDAIDTSLAHLRRWMSWARNEPSTLAATRFLLTMHKAEFDVGQQWHFGIFANDESHLHGVAGLHPLPTPGALEISYWLRRSATRRGYATEAAGELTRIAIRRRDVRFLQIRCDPANERSAAIARRLGYRHVGTIEPGDRTPDGASRSMVWQLDSRRQ